MAKVAYKGKGYYVPEQFAGPFDNLIGELWPGALGWLPLDENGTPNGPATIEPPEDTDIPVCRVFANFAPNFDHDLLVTPSGGPITDRMIPNSERRVIYPPPPPPEPTVPPTLTSISPTTAEVGGPDFTLECVGTNFSPNNTVIVFNGGEEPTVFVDDTHVTTGVKPSLVSNAIDVPVLIRTGFGDSLPLTFSFTPLPEGTTRDSEGKARK